MYRKSQVKISIISGCFTILCNSPQRVTLFTTLLRFATVFRKRFMLILILSLMPCTVVAQERNSYNVDSAIIELEITKEDTIRLNIYRKLIKSEMYVDQERSEQWAKEGLEICKKNSANPDSAKLALVSKRAAWFCNVIGSINIFRGLMGVAMENYKRTLFIARRTNDTVQMGSVYNNIGLIHFYQEDFSGALENYIKCYEFRMALNDESRIQIVLQNLGEVYQHLADSSMEAGNPVEYDRFLKLSWDHYTQCVARARESGSTSSEAAALVSLGNILRQEGLHAEGLKMALSGLQLSLESENRSIQAYSYRYVSFFYQDLNNYEKAAEYAKNGYLIANEAKILNEQRDISKLLYSCYKELGDSKNALLFYTNYIVFRDSLQSDENEKALYNQTYQIEYQKKVAADSVAFADEKALINAELSKQTAKLSQERSQIYGLLAGILLIGAFAFIIVRGYLQKRRTNRIIRQQKQEVENQQSRFLDDLDYAEKIQRSILPEIRKIRKHLPGFSALYIPKDVVSGDFYWFAHIENCSYLALSDCTGHGVPGGFMSMIGSTLLKEIIVREKINDPAKILELMDEYVRELLHQHDENSSDDGMEIAILKIDHSQNSLTFSGANQHLYLLRDEVEFVRSNLRSIGGWVRKKSRLEQFTNTVVELESVRAIYLSTDGLEDQFGGANNEKFGRERFVKELDRSGMLASLDNVRSAFTQWKGGQDQIDDVCVIGLRL